MLEKQQMNDINKPPYYRAVESIYSFNSTEWVITHSVDHLEIGAVLHDSVFNCLSDNIYNLNRIINGIQISEENTQIGRYHYTCKKIYYNENGNQTARIDIKLFRNIVESENWILIRVNPNKSFNDKRCLQDLETLLGMTQIYIIEKMDIAIDIPIDKSLVHLIKDKRAKLDYQASMDSKTEYLGKCRNNVGHVKLYDKRKECRLSSDLTRLEITVGNPLSENWSRNIIGYLPQVSIIMSDCQESNLSQNLNDTEKVLIALLRSTPKKVDYWNSLGYKMKRKIKSFVFAGDFTFSYDMEAIEETAANAVKAIKFPGSYYMNQYIHPFY